VDQLSPRSVVAFRDTTYSLYLIQAHGDKESDIWLELRLLCSQGSGRVDQADAIIETTPIQPEELEIPLVEQDPLFQP